MSVKIALAGNPNSGKTTLFNALTGSNQYVGNWPGVTVEKKEGKLKGHKDIIITDLPGIYSLSPYTLEEVVARNYLIKEYPDAIINIIDGTNIERNLYLSTQLIELGIPVIMAVNMMDLVKKNGDKIDIKNLSNALGCEVVEISALKGTGIDEVKEKAVAAAQKKVQNKRVHSFDQAVEDAIDSVSARIRLVTILSILSEVVSFSPFVFFFTHFPMIDEIYAYLSLVIILSVSSSNLSSSALISSLQSGTLSICSAIFVSFSRSLIAKNLFFLSSTVSFALPIFIIVMWLVYYIAMSTVGAWCTDWTNDNLFGDGFHLFGIGTKDYEEASGDYDAATNALDAYGVLVTDDEDAIDVDATKAAIEANTNTEASVKYQMEDEETLDTYDIDVYYSEVPAGAKKDKTNAMSYLDAS